MITRQSTTPVQFGRTTRVDEFERMSSARAGVVVMADYAVVLRGDSCSGSFSITADLGELPRPLLNRTKFNVQAWFVPKTSHPKFSGYDEFMNAYQGEQIKTLGAADRNPPEFFDTVSGADVVTIAGSDMFKTLGLHIAPGATINTDLIDAFWTIYNFRLASFSSRLPRAQYYAEDPIGSLSFPPAFWPANRLTGVVPDYERALITGALNLDVAAGQIPVKTDYTSTDGRNPQAFEGELKFMTSGVPVADIWADLQDFTIPTTLADIDKARVGQAFAKLRTAMAGNDATGFDNDDAIVAELMQGFRVPEDQFKRPWLLDAETVQFAMSERPATDGANLDKSLTKGMAMAELRINLPAQDVGGIIVFTVECVPERIYEGQSDEFLYVTKPNDLPDALRDVLRPEPVDLVLNRRVDSRHTAPNGLYGYEPMNDKWNRRGTALGGVFYQPNPADQFLESRSGIWTPKIVDPTYTADHFLCPSPFPHDVFSDSQAPAFEFVCEHKLRLRGLTQIGDVLAENNDDYAALEDEQPA